MLTLAAADPLEVPYTPLPSRAADVLACAGKTTPACSFLRVDARWGAYRAIDLTPPAELPPTRSMKWMTQRLRAKAEARDRLVKDYTRVAREGDAGWAVAAACRAAETKLEFVRVMRAVPPPASLPPEAADLFVAEIESMAWPVEDEAIHMLRDVAASAARLGVDSPWSRRCGGLLKQLAK